MANTYNRYGHYDLWFNDKWEDRQSPLLPLTIWIGQHARCHAEESSTYPLFPAGTDRTKLPLYRAKTQSIDVPEVIRHWDEKGLRCTVLEMGRAHWISMVPKATGLQRGDKLPVLLVFHREILSDPYWAMRTVEYYDEYNKMAIREKVIVLYLVIEEEDTSGMYGNMLQEAMVLYPIDPYRVFLDISVARSAGVSLKEIPGYSYTGGNGLPADPDSAIRTLGTVPVLDIAKRWENRDSLTRNLIMNYTMNKNDFDIKKVLHSENGQKMAEGIALEYNFQTIMDPGFTEYWAERGLQFDIHDTKGERWTTVVPKSATENPQNKLPVVVIMQEVNYSNEHLAVNAMSYFHEYQNIASNGDAILLYFVLEDPDSNELLCEILDQAAKEYPIDRSRVYITGHSHDGYFSMIFARRHPEIIAAVATLGNSNGIMDPGISGEAVFASSDEQVELMGRNDMPVINLLGCHEGPSFDRNVHIKSWQRRLKASRCPIRTAEEIDAALGSEDKATRVLGVPNDKSETLYADGFEHYIADIRNTDGKHHLRVVKIEGMPHVTTPFMLNLSWAFMRRFSRDKDTGKIIELF